VRVIDYFPKQLEDFAVPCKISEYDVLSDCGSSDSDRELEENWRQWDEGHGWGGEMRWEWRFYLLLEDSEATRSSSTDGSSARLKVLIAEQDAVMLLKMDAEKYITINVVATVQSVHALINGSLRKSPTALATLREKLFILWGDLEERKAAEASALKPRDANRGQITNALDGRKISTKSSAPVAKPFVCCLKEYGVRTRMVKSVGSDDCNDEAEEDANGWERRFRMFGTVIM